jgi:tetratricopeptide (TPR) repeat protein
MPFREFVSRWFRSSGPDAAASVVTPQPVASPANGRTDDPFRAGADAYREGRWDEAARHFAVALERQPEAAEVHYFLGLAQHKLGALEDAADSLLVATAHRRDYVEALHALGAVYLALGRAGEAKEYLAQALALAPADVKLLNELGRACLDREEFEEAIAHFRQAFELAPALAAPMTNLAYALTQADQDLPEALALAREAVRLAPGSADASCNLGLVSYAAGQDAEALAAFEAALQAVPGHPRSAVNRALIHLAHGRLAVGWADYEARHLIDAGLLRAAAVYPYPDWQGEDLRGKTILVYGEQGLGDELMFASCIPDLLAQAAHVMIECAPRAEKLVARSFPAATTVGAAQLRRTAGWLRERGKTPDYKVAVGSLPRRFRNAPEAFPDRGGYLRVDSARAAFWRKRLAALGPGPKIGLSWRGGTARTRARHRSMTLADALPLFGERRAIVSLQYGDTQSEISALRAQSGAVLHSFPEALSELDDTAALLAATDFVVSVDNTAALLAGALGHTGCVLLSDRAEWRYPRTGAQWPWFPTLRLCRREPAAGWDAVVHEVSRLIAGWNPRGTPDT